MRRKKSSLAIVNYQLSYYYAISIVYLAVCLFVVFHEILTITSTKKSTITFLTAAAAEEVTVTNKATIVREQITTPQQQKIEHLVINNDDGDQQFKASSPSSAEAVALVHRTVQRSIDDFDDEVDELAPPQPQNFQGPSGGSTGQLLPGVPPNRIRSAEHLLHAMLFAPGRYQKNVRPLADHERSIKVKLGVCVMTIDEILEKDQTMITSGCVKMKWNDEFLQWSPEDFKNLSWMALPSTDIWIPDIALINSPDPYYITRKPAFSEVAHTGDVGYYPSGRFSTRCQISLTYFPFDWQKCELRFESWVYPVQWLYMEPWTPEPVDMKDYYRNHQWDLDRFSVTPGNATYDGLDFSTIRFSFYFRRRTLYYCVLSIFPCLIMSVLQMFSHTLPVEHPARMTLLTSLFVSSSVIQSSLASQMPKSSDGVSLIQLYLMIFSTNLLISMLITFMNMHVWFRVPMSVIPTMSRMLRAYFLDTGRPQLAPQQHATATSAIAAISAAAVPLLPGGVGAQPTVSYRSQQPSSSLLRKIGRKMHLIKTPPSGSHHHHGQHQHHHHNMSVVDPAAQRTDEEEAAIPMVERGGGPYNRRSNLVSRRNSPPDQPPPPPSSSAVVIVESTAGPSTSGGAVWQANRAFPRETTACPGSSPFCSSTSSDDNSSSVEAEYNLKSRRTSRTGPSHNGSPSPGCCYTCCMRNRRNNHRGGQQSQHRQHHHQHHQNPTSATNSTQKRTPGGGGPYDTPPPPPPSKRPGVVISLQQSGGGPQQGASQQPAASNLAERKDRWLQFSMLIDKVFLYAMFVYNLLCPVVIFGLVPQIQMFYMDDDASSVYFDPAKHIRAN